MTVILGLSIFSRQGVGGTTRDNTSVDITSGSLGAPEGNTTQFRMARLFSAFRYGFGRRYIIEGGYSRDGISKFDQDVRNSDFYSVGASWIPSEEAFFPKNNVLTSVRVYGSYGLLGNIGIAGGNFPALETYSASQFLSELSVYKSDLINQEIEWEKTNSLNIGLALDFFKGRLGLTGEFFDRQTRDLVLDLDLPPSTGFTERTVNRAGIQSTGVDITLVGVPIRKKDLYLELNFNASFSRSTVTSLPVGPGGVEDTLFDGQFRRFKDGNYYDIYGADFRGIDTNTGYALYSVKPCLKCPSELTYNRTLAEAQRNRTEQIIGNALPDLIGGFGASMSFYNFDVSFQASYQIGGDGLVNSTFREGFGGPTTRYQTVRREHLG